MSPSEATGTPTIKPTAKPARKGKGKPASEGKRSLNLSIPQEDYERIAIHALRLDITISDLVCQLGRAHLRDYHITRTATTSRSDGDPRQ